MALAASLFRRRRVLLAGLILACLAWASGGAWRLYRGPLRAEQRFQITAQSVRISPPPPWVQTDIRAQAIDRASTQGPLTVIDPTQAIARIAEAFRLEPWVKRVTRVELQAPNQATVELEWRQPIGVVEYASPEGVSLLALDVDSVRLPPPAVQQAELRRMPRIVGVRAAPPLGEAWVDPPVNGAVRLIAHLGAEWTRLSLAEVAASQLEIRGDQQFYRFEIQTIGGTRIVWGAAPDVPCEEPPFSVKLARLQQFVTQNRVELDGRNSPDTIDLRRDLQATKRIARKKDDSRTAQRDGEAGADAELTK